MPVIPYQARGLPSAPSATATTAGSLRVSWLRLFWAAFTVGKTPLFQLGPSLPNALSEFGFRAELLRATLEETSTGRLVRTPNWQWLDPSEKAAISYFLGMTTTKLVADRIFSTPWLIHVDLFRGAFGITLRDRRRPDLAGIDTTGGWTVMEAKGRSNSISFSQLDDAKDQTRRVADIGGAAPSTRVAVGTYFSGPSLACRIVDPDGHEDADLRWGFSPTDLLREYYAPIITFLNSHETTIHEDHERSYRIAHVSDDIGLGLGLDERILRPGLERLDLASVLKLRNAGTDAHEREGDDHVEEHEEDGSPFVGRDGVIVLESTEAVGLKARNGG